MLRIGIDVGGTNTDAVILKGRELLAAFKAPTTDDVQTGVVDAIEDVLTQAGIAPSRIDCIMIGTTQFTNAFVEGRQLVPVGVIRLALPAATAVPPMIDWPEKLARAVKGDVVMVAGGYEYDGKEISPLDEIAVRAAAIRFRQAGIASVAISCTFAPINAAMEEHAAAIVREEMPDAAITLSGALGRMGLIERENAGVMNASLSSLAGRVVSSFRGALRNLGIASPFYISQNDGTLMEADEAARHPVLTFASGPTNSMRGAAFLTGLAEAIVVDIGGTTSDIGCLVHSFPRESAVAIDIGGVRTNFRTPDIIALGLGGGSLVRGGEQVEIGPDSLGFRIRERARIFGGDTLTATDIAVAARRVEIGDRSRIDGLDPAFVDRAVSAIDAKLAEGVDRMKTSGADVPLILVGGGSVLVGQHLEGASELVVPPHAGVANAIGAAIAQVSGEVDSLFDYTGRTREEILSAAQQQAKQKAISGGATPESLCIVEIEEVPLGYMPGAYARVRVKAVGDLDLAVDNETIATRTAP